jgi:hypothetical protein
MVSALIAPVYCWPNAKSRMQPVTVPFRAAERKK